ncbi:MAG: hypothetical protein PWP46_123 [Fusobacteriaceae bacterium]|jgi:hypothetical protein|nr:hypothetical protein [Fusobacteriales bacterium]MDN5303244.1 hypothetical protein [Fusobacteriaceae bacterium]
MKEIIEIKRDYDVYNICSLCYNLGKTHKIFTLELGNENKGERKSKKIKICDSCLKKLKIELDKEL